MYINIARSAMFNLYIEKIRVSNISVIAKVAINMIMYIIPVLTTPLNTLAQYSSKFSPDFLYKRYTDIARIVTI